MIRTGSQMYLLDETLNVLRTAELRSGIEKGGRSSRDAVPQRNLETILPREAQHHRCKETIAGPDDARGPDRQAIRAERIILADQQGAFGSS